MTDRMIAVRYVGKKANAYDNIARSGATWNGFGDVQHVTDAQAKILIKHPDQWQLDNPDDAFDVNAPVSLSVVDEDGDRVSIDPEELKKPLERMSKSELVALAKDHFGKTLDARRSTKSLIDQIEEFRRDLDITVGRRDQ